MAIIANRCTAAIAPMHFVFVKGNGLLIWYALIKLWTFSIQSQIINQNPVHTESSQRIINNLQIDSVKISRKNEIDVRFGQVIHK